jgi:hypothetical protein
MEVGGKGEKGPGQYDKLVVGPGDDGIFMFQIKTPGIKFNPDDPVTIKRQGPGKDLSKQFITKVIDEDTLVVADPNADQALAEYYYQLNFVSPTPPLDPIITNGCCKVNFAGTGGGTGGMQLMSVEGVLVVLAVATLLAILGNVVWRRFT